MQEKENQNKKQHAYPKWKAFFDGLFLLGAFLLVGKLIVLGMNYVFNVEVLATVEMLPKIIINFFPLTLMIIGGIGSDNLKNKYMD